MGILGIIWDLLMWGVGIFCSAVGLGVGILASYVIYGAANYIGRTISLNLNRSLVDFLLRTVLFVVSFIFCLIVRVPLKEVFGAFLTYGNFNELYLQFVLGEHLFIVNDTISMIWNQLMMTFIFFLPYFFMTEAINLIKFVLCDPQEDAGYSFISFIPELMTLFAANVFVLYCGNGLAYRLLEFIQIIDIRFGLLRMLFNMLLFCFYFYRVVCDFFGSDIFLTMIGAVVATTLMGVPLTGGTHTILLILCYVIGYISKSARSAVVAAFAGINSAGIVDVYHIVYGIVSIFLTTGIFMIVLKVMGC